MAMPDRPSPTNTRPANPRDLRNLRTNSILLIVFLAALAVRVWGIKWALPAVIHHDERNVGLAVLKALFSGDLSPQFYYYPALAVLTHYVAAVAAFLVESSLGLLGTLTDLRLQDYLPYARLLSAIAGALTVLVVAKTARSICPAAGIPAAVISALPFLGVLHSHYATPDAALALFVQLAILFSFLSLSRNCPRLSLWAAVFAAIAASLKYTGALVIIPAIVAAALAGPKHARSRRMTVTAVIALLVFSALNIGAIMDLRVFIDHVRFEAVHYLKAGNLGLANLVSENPHGFMFHIRAMLGDVGYITAGLSILGIIVCASCPLGRKYLLLLAAFVIPHIALFSIARAAFPRNVLPVTPAVAVLAGIAIARLAEAFRTKSIRPKVIVIATALAVFLPARGALLNDYIMTRPCTLAKVQEWFMRNGGRVARPGYRVASLHSLWTPRTIGGRDLSIGEIFLRHAWSGESLPDPAWFIGQGVVFFTVESWGIKRYCSFEWPARMLRLVRLHCVLVETIEGWPPEPLWFSDHGFAVPKVGPKTYFGPATEIYMLRPYLIQSSADRETAASSTRSQSPSGASIRPAREVLRRSPAPS